MARPKRPTQRMAPPVIPSNSLVASATRFDKKVARIYQQTQNWQTECYRHYAICGEARFAANFFGHALSKTVLTISEKTPEGLEVQTSGPGYDALTDLFNGKDGQAQMLQAAGTHLTIAGEAYLVGRTVTGEGDTREGVEVAAGEELWEVLSPLEIRTQGTGENMIWFVTYGDGYEDIQLTDDDAVIRIWSPNPAKRMEADSPFRSLLPILTEIEWLTRHIFAQVSSRLVGAGILWVSQGLSFPPPLDSEGKAIETANDADGLMRVLGDVMVNSMADNGTAASQVPIIVSVPPDLVGRHAELMHFWSDLDAASMDLRSEAIRRFAIGMDLPAEQILGMSSNEGSGGGNSNGVCVDTETEALTQRGWLRHDQIETGDLVLSLNHATGLSEWKPVTAVRHYEVTGQEMFRLNGTAHSSFSTAEHRWPVLRDRQENGVVRTSREWVRSADLTYAHKIPTAAPHADLPAEPKWADDLVELVGWFWTEGYLPPEGARGNRTCTITQSHTRNPERVARIRACLNRLYGSGQWGSEHITQPFAGGPCTSFHLRKQVVGDLRALGGKHPETGFIRSLTRAQLELFIDVSCQGDGWHYRQGRLDIWQRDESALDAYELALILSGRMVSRTEHNGGTCVSDWRGKSTVRPVKAAAAPSGTVAEKVEFTGTVWCPEVADNHTWLARRDGTVYFTANSHWGAWQIEEATIKMHIEPMLELVSNALTIGYIRPLLPTSSAEVVTYDTSALKLRPDRSREAFELYDRGAISLAALLRENGMDEADAPGDDELKTYFLRKIASGSATPEQVSAALKALFGIDLPTESSEGLGAVRESRPSPSLEEHPEKPRTPGETQTPDPPNHAALVLASEGLVLRALEKAGNRILNDGKRGKDRAVSDTPAYQAYLFNAVNGHGDELLRDGFTFAPEVLSGLGDCETVVPVLREYCIDLFATRQPHTRRRLAHHLETALG